ncbi:MULTISPECIES: MATE family efflux transporter [unclassified Flavobacterium]|uniref:MATE family efflux transporter n=1 Tax=unclassified Flavobacterium TaxID=196869 RepID=UPI0012AA35EF|nr:MULTISPECIES: MATE family efflux transporter [unclassified Flavobacterium]MBF4483662.1 oligosaccharide flippase family protein [Flavobacterium sp. CSZ]QGK76221.1 oligosaccharide flippase family protein [Flavobacterium sp. SLB02]
MIERISKNSFIKQSLGTLALRIFGVLLLFGFTIFLTKSYSPKLVGQYDFVRSYLLAVGSICLLGFDQSILYFKGRLASQKEVRQLKMVYLKMVRMLFLTSLLILALFLIIDKKRINTYFLDDEVYPILLKSSVILFFHGLSLLNTEVFRALDKLYVAELFRNIIKYIPLIIGSVVLFYMHLEAYLVDVFLIGFIFLALISSVLVFIYFNKKETVSDEIFTSKEIFTKSYPIAISGMAMFLLMSFDIMFLKKYQNDETVAFYSVGVKIMTIVSVIILTINITVSAKIAEYFSNQNWIELKKTLQSSARLIFCISFPVIILISVFSDYVLSLFGNQYIIAQKSFLILIIGQGICSLFGSAPVYLNMTGRQHIFQVILIGAVIINFILNRFLIPIYGMTGAAAAFFCSSFFWNFVSAVVIYKKDKIKIFLH